MEKELQFFLGESLLDVPKQEQMRFFLDISVSDLSTLESTRFSKSKTVTLPGTDTNRKLFGFSELPPSGSGLDQTTKPDIRVEYDGTAIFYGFVKMTEPIYDAENELSEYKLILLGDNGEWKTDIKDKNIMDLDFSAQDHVYNKANIDTSETVDASRAYVYPLINYGHPQSATGDMLAGTHDVAISDRTPAWQVSKLLIELFNTIGYKVDSPFFETGFGSKLYIPFTRSKMTFDDTFARDGSKHFRAGLTAPFTVPGQTNNNHIILQIPFDEDDDSPEFFDTDGLYNTSTFTYTVPDKSRMTFEAFITINQSVADTTQKFATIRFKRNGVIFSQESFIVLAGDASFNVSGKTGYRGYVGGEDITVELEIRTLGTSFNEFDILVGGYFKNIATNAINVGDTIPVNRTLPDMLQTDFLDWLKDMFNLYFLADIQRKTIVIVPRDEFYTGEPIDWSDKVDISKPIKTNFLGDNLNQIIRYRYTDDPDDIYVEEINRQRDKFLASHDQTIANKFAPKGIKEISTGFAPTVMDTMPGIGLVSSQVPRMWNEYLIAPEVPLWRTAFKHRILFYDGVVPVADGEEWTFATIARTDYPYFYSVDNITQNNNSLYFDDQPKSVGLFNKFYKNTHQIIDDGKLVTMDLHLTEQDINILNLRTPIFIEIKGDGMVYTINKIDKYSPLQQGNTEVELLQLFDINAPPDFPDNFIKDQVPDTAGDPIPDGTTILIDIDEPTDNVYMGTLSGRPSDGVKNTVNLGRSTEPLADDQVMLGQYARPSADYSLIIGDGSSVNSQSNGLVINSDGIILAQEALAGFTLLPAKDLIDSSIAPPTEVDGDIYLLDNANGVLNVDSILHQSGSLIRYSSAGADLSGVSAGDWLEVKGSTNAINDGRFPIKTVNDGSDFIELHNELRSDATDDEAAGATMSAVHTDYDGAAQGDWIRYYAADDLWRHFPLLKGMSCYNEARNTDYQYTTIWGEKQVRLEDHYVMGFDLQHQTSSLLTQVGANSIRSVCRDFQNTFDILDFTSQSNDLGASGAGGLDTGTVVASTWYYIYVIASSSDPVTFPTSTLASLTSLTPTVLPTGYDKSRMLGFVVTNSGATALEAYLQVVSPFSQHIRRYYWDRERTNSIFNLSGGKRTIYTIIPFGTLLPNIIKGVAHLTVEYTVVSASTNKAHFKPGGTGQVIPPHSFTEPGVTGDPLVIPVDIPWTDPNYQYHIDNNTDFVELYCTGFTLSI